MSDITHKWPSPGRGDFVTEMDSISPREPVETPLPMTLIGERSTTRPLVNTPVVFPGYEILAELGRGGMGVVYKARQRNLNRLVALKVILGGPLASQEDKARFHIEAEAAARLHHPNIVQVYDVGEYAGFSFMSLELIEGDTLRQWQNGRKIDPKHAAKLVSVVARGIQHAHEHGIIHRDIKPANILLGPVPEASGEHGSTVTNTVRTAWLSSPNSRTQSNGSSTLLNVTPKVTDFGLAKAIEGGDNLTVTGVACGTPNYMAPEQVRGRALGPCVDVYGLGAVLFELLTGQAPFVGSEPPEVMNQILRTEAPSVRKFVSNAPRDIAVIVAKCLEKEPTRRYASARELAEDLERFIAGKPITARPIGTTERTWRWVRRNPVVAGFLCFSTIGCSITGALAVALATKADEERAARFQADWAYHDAREQHKKLEQTRDELMQALTDAEISRKQAVVARNNADEHAALALDQQQTAEAAQRQSEVNLRIARNVIRVSIKELSNHPRFQDEDFRAARNTLLQQGREFRNTVAAKAPNTAEWLDNIADVSHWLGFLEYLNNNQAAAAEEYFAAAQAASKLAKLEPNSLEPRGRQVHSLVNAGNASTNARRYQDAEAAYREAIAVVETIVVSSPKHEFYLRQAIEPVRQLANLYRITDKVGEREFAARLHLERAERLVRICGDNVPNLQFLAVAHMDVAAALSRRGKWDEAACSYSESLATRNKIREANPTIPQYANDCANALLAQAAFFLRRGLPEQADANYREATEILAKTFRADPSVNDHCLEYALAESQYAEILRGRNQTAEAEKRFNAALEATTILMRRTPSYKNTRVVAADVAIGRANLLNQTGRHKEAYAEWMRLAKEDPEPRMRVRHQLFAIQSLIFLHDIPAAKKQSSELQTQQHPGWVFVDLARTWCLIGKSLELDSKLTPDERLQESEAAFTRAIQCLEKARAAGEFNNPEQLRWYTTQAAYDPIRNRFDPKKK
jgi:serine/threonine protein kinase/tetratricopeptide (TPR) repeat protein